MAAEKIGFGIIGAGKAGKGFAGILQDCADAECYQHCYQAELTCWIEYTCVWDQNQSRCENGEQTQTSTTMAKTLTEQCARDPECDKEQ